MKTFLLLLFTLIIPVASFAAGGGDGEHHPSIKDTIFPAINFAIYAGILYWVLTKKVNVSQKLKERSERLKSEMDEAESIKREAESKFNEITEKLTKMEIEREAMLAQAKKDAQALKAKIIEQAELRKVEILKSAKDAAQLEIQKARADLKDEIFETAMGLALEAAKNNINSNDHQRILKETVGSIQNSEAGA